MKAIKHQVRLDAFNDRFPDDSSLISLTGVSKVLISNFISDNVPATIQIIQRDNKPMLAYNLSEDTEIVVPDDKPWIGFNFMALGFAENQNASFEFELLNV